LAPVELRTVIVVPVFNHGAAFARVFERLRRFGLPIIAVDDGSDEETNNTLADLASRCDSIAIIRHPSNRGKGAAVISGIRHANAAGYDHVLQIDADGQHDIEDLPRFLEAARKHPDAVIIGTPVFDSSMPLGRRIGRQLTHVCIWAETLSFDITDSMCGFRVYPVAAVLPLLATRGLGQRMDFDPEILVRLHWRGTPIQAVNTRVTYPAGGSSNFRLFKDNVLITSMHIRLLLGMLWRLPSTISSSTADQVIE
jgi:glycosyltransferase involved in cell wall biosynthesis